MSEINTTLAIHEIAIAEGRREIDQEAVERLAESIKQIELTLPGKRSAPGRRRLRIGSRPTPDRGVQEAWPGAYPRRHLDVHQR